jgi:hypothetical protein
MPRARQLSRSNYKMEMTKIKDVNHPFKPKLSDFQILAPNPGGRKARPYNTLLNLLGRGEVYPRPHTAGHCSNLRIAIAQLWLKQEYRSGWIKVYNN